AARPRRTPTGTRTHEPVAGSHASPSLDGSANSRAHSPAASGPVGSGHLVPVRDQAGLDDQLAARRDHPKRAIGHAQLAVWRCGGRLDHELAVDLADLRVELKRDRTAAGGQPTTHFERVTL